MNVNVPGRPGPRGGSILGVGPDFLERPSSRGTNASGAGLAKVTAAGKERRGPSRGKSFAGCPVFISVTRTRLDLTASMPVYDRPFLDPGQASGRGPESIGSVTGGRLLQLRRQDFQNVLVRLRWIHEGTSMRTASPCPSCHPACGPASSNTSSIAGSRHSWRRRRSPRRRPPGGSGAGNWTARPVAGQPRSPLTGPTRHPGTGTSTGSASSTGTGTGRPVGNGGPALAPILGSGTRQRKPEPARDTGSATGSGTGTVAARERAADRNQHRQFHRKQPVGSQVAPGPSTGDRQIGASVRPPPIIPPTGSQMIDVDGFNVSAAKVAALHAADSRWSAILTWAAMRQDVPTPADYPAALRLSEDPDWGRVSVPRHPRRLQVRLRAGRHSSTSASRCARTRASTPSSGQLGQLGREPRHPDRAGSGRFRRLGRRTPCSAGHSRSHSELPGTRDQGGPAGQRLVDKFDFELDEQCQEYSECDSFTEFTKSGKATSTSSTRQTSRSLLRSSAACRSTRSRRNLDLVGAGRFRLPATDLSVEMLRKVRGRLKKAQSMSGLAT